MNDVLLQEVEHPSKHTSYIHELLDKVEGILHQHRYENPDLYRMVEERKIIKEAKKTPPLPMTSQPVNTASVPKLIESIYFRQSKQTELKKKIEASHQLIHEHHIETQSLIVPRTQARNAKQSYCSIEEITADRSDKLSSQIQAWRSVLPILIRRFKKIHDPRRAKSVKHQLAVVMLYGLLAFIFRLSSRREINRELSGIIVFENLKRIFPKLESIPHADTLARLLEKINVNDIERTHIALINQLIRNKKFKKILISGCLPVAIDGTQKLYRDGELHDLHWLSRKVGSEEAGQMQQYVYALEANIVFKNGLTIPLLTEYLKTDWDVFSNPEGKQDCELVAFKRLTAKLKKYFPRLKIMMFADALFATQPVLEILNKYRWEYIIQFSKNKLKNFAELLNLMKDTAQTIPGQAYYGERYQEFYWYHNFIWGYELQLKIHLVSCQEKWEEVDKKTGDIIIKYSQHQWLSSIRTNIENVHELCNLGARKIGLMEDSIHTEKHRGYHYEHAFSYSWNAMQGFHLLMRMAHTVNALSEFTKKMKKWIKEQGCSAVLKLIKETIFNPWLPREWYEQQHKKTVWLTLQLE
ncbi:MAG TPA: transposase family protein [Waddliaceae bacterium]